MQLIPFANSVDNNTISIHASLMGCNICQKKWSQSFWISIHASLMGCNQYFRQLITDVGNFNSCIPYGMQPLNHFVLVNPFWISIHASLMGCNTSSLSCITHTGYFNSCIPYGMQPQNIVFIFPFILYFVYIVLYYLPLYPLHNHIYQFTFLYWCESPSAFMCA